MLLSRVTEELFNPGRAGEWAKVTINGGITGRTGGEIVSLLWSWCRRRSALRDAIEG